MYANDSELQIGQVWLSCTSWQSRHSRATCNCMQSVYVLFRLLQLRPLAVRVLCHFEKFGVVRRRLGAVAQPFGGARATVNAAEPVRLLLHRQLERGERFTRFAGLEQHVAIQ